MRRGDLYPRRRQVKFSTRARVSQEQRAQSPSRRSDDTSTNFGACQDRQVRDGVQHIRFIDGFDEGETG
jgi:hypothetical protein